MSVQSVKKRKIVGWNQINQNTTVDWAKGDGSATNKKILLEVTDGRIPQGSEPRTNEAGFTGKDGPTRIMADMIRYAKGGYTLPANPESIAIFLTMLFGAPASSVDNGDTTYTHTWNLSSDVAEHYGNAGFLDYEGNVDRRIDGMRAGTFSIKSAGVDQIVQVTFAGMGKGCDEVSATNADEASGTGAHGFQRWGFSVAKTAASASGLANDATVYTCNITTDGGTPEAVAITGSAAQTLQLVLDGLNADLDDANAEWSDDGYGYIKIVSNTTGATSTVLIADVDLFGTLTSHNLAAETAVAGYAYYCITLSDFFWKDCSFSVNAVADALIRDVEIAIDRGLVEHRVGSKYLAFPRVSRAIATAKFSRWAEDNTYQQKEIEGTLHPFVWTISSADTIGTGSRNPSLTMTISKLFIRTMPANIDAGGLEGLSIAGECIRECGDASNNIISFALVNTIASYAIST